MGTESQNPLPNDVNNDEDVANSFADFFQSMIKMICEILMALRFIIQKVMILQTYASLHQ